MCVLAFLSLFAVCFFLATPLYEEAGGFDSKNDDDYFERHENGE